MDGVLDQAHAISNASVPSSSLHQEPRSLFKASSSNPALIPQHTGGILSTDPMLRFNEMAGLSSSNGNVGSLL